MSNPKGVLSTSQGQQAFKTSTAAPNFNPITYAPRAAFNTGKTFATGFAQPFQRTASFLAPTGILGPRPQDVVEEAAIDAQRTALRNGVHPDDAETIANNIRSAGYGKILNNAGVNPNDSKFTVGRKFAANAAQTVASADIAAPAAEAVTEGAAKSGIVKLGGKILASVKGGAEFGALNALGADKVTPKDVVESAAKTAAAASAVPVVGYGAGRVLSPVVEKISPSVNGKVKTLLKQRSDLVDSVSNPETPKSSPKGTPKVGVGRVRPDGSIVDKVTSLNEMPKETVPVDEKTLGYKIKNAKDPVRKTALIAERDTRFPKEVTDENLSTIRRETPPGKSILPSKGAIIKKAIPDFYDNVDRQPYRENQLRGTAKNSIPTFNGLSDAEKEQASLVAEGKAQPGSPAVAKAAIELRTTLDKIQKDAVTAGVSKEGSQATGYRQNYFPSRTDWDAVRKNPDAYAQQLVNTKAFDNINDARSFINKSIQLHKSGNLEFSRDASIQGLPTLPAKKVLDNYINRTSSRISQAEAFGANGEKINKAFNDADVAGVDTRAAREAYDKTYVNPDKANKLVRGITKATSVARLGVAAISHVPQISNTIADEGLINTVKGFAGSLRPEERSLVRDSGVLEDIGSIKNQEMSSRFTAPGLNTLQGVYRTATALAAKYSADDLAAKGNTEALRAMGVTGDVGKTLTNDQHMQIMQKAVKDNFFRSTPLDTPLKAETSGGKVFGQYRTSYLYKQIGKLGNLLDGARNGNVKPLMKFLVASGVLSAGTVLGKNAISGKKEGPGGVALDVASSVLGLPGELAVSAGRYAAGDVSKFVAGTVAPSAGEAVTIGDDITKAIKGSPKSLESYGAGLVPVIGSRLSKKVNPPPATPKVGTVADKQANTKKEEADYRDKVAKGTGEGYGLTQLSDGSYIYNIGSDVHTTKDKGSAQQAILKDSLKNSGDTSRTIGDTYYYKDESGDVKSQPVVLHQYDQSNAKNQLAMDVAYRASDLTAWTKAASDQYDALEAKKKLYNPATEQDKIDAITNQQQDLLYKLKGYQEKGINGAGGSAKANALDMSTHRYLASTKAAGGLPKLSVRDVGSSGRSKITYRSQPKIKATLKKGAKI